jgi:cbb3-type cytochrome oxidase subunit 3
MISNVKRILIFGGILASVVVACLGLETQDKNHIGLGLFIAGVACCAAGSLYLGISTYRQSVKTEDKDLSLWLVFPGVLIISLVAPLEFLYLAATLPRNDLMQDLGLVLLGASMPLCLWAGFLHAKWTNQQTLPDGVLQKATSRILRLLNYSVYVGLGVLALGICIGYSSAIGLFVCIMFFIALVYQIFMENKNYRDRFDKNHPA